MELTDIMALVKAGYTKDEIAQMEGPVQNPAEPVPVGEVAPVKEPAPAQVVEPVAVAEAKAVPEPQPQPAQDQTTLADIMKGIAKLTSAVQANAIAQSVIPQGLSNPPSAEDMLAEIIRPTIKERG